MLEDDLSTGSKTSTDVEGLEGRLLGEGRGALLQSTYDATVLAILLDGQQHEVGNA